MDVIKFMVVLILVMGMVIPLATSTVSGMFVVMNVAHVMYYQGVMSLEEG